MQTAEEFMQEFFRARKENFEKIDAIRAEFRQPFVASSCSYWSNARNRAEMDAERISKISKFGNRAEVYTSRGGLLGSPLRYILSRTGQSWLMQDLHWECSACKGTGQLRRETCFGCSGSGWQSAAYSEKQLGDAPSTTAKEPSARGVLGISPFWSEVLRHMVAGLVLLVGWAASIVTALMAMNSLIAPERANAERIAFGVSLTFLLISLLASIAGTFFGFRFLVRPRS